MKVLTIEYELSIELLQVIDWYCYMYMQEFISIQETPEEILLHTKSILRKIKEIFGLKNWFLVWKYPIFDSSDLSFLKGFQKIL